MSIPSTGGADPTALTTAQLHHEIEGLKELVGQRLDQQAHAVETALAAQVKAVETALAAVTEQARQHAANHEQQHAQHERIHDVEKVAIDKADRAMDRRLDGMNEFRDQLRDQSNTFVSREVVDARLVAQENTWVGQHHATTARVEEIEKRLASAEGRSAGYSGLYAIIATGFGIVVAAIVLANYLSSH